MIHFVKGPKTNGRIDSTGFPVGWKSPIFDTISRTVINDDEMSR